MSFALAKDWLLKQQKASSEALQLSAVNEEARGVVADLSRSLAELPASTAALLEQPASRASPAVAPPVMSLGPEPVTDHVRAEERAEKRACRQAEEPSQKGTTKEEGHPTRASGAPAESSSTHVRVTCPSTPGKYSFLCLIYEILFRSLPYIYF